jgi:hypothetical protein
MKPVAVTVLAAYAAIVSTALLVTLAANAMRGPGPARFTEIDAERINIREPDGALRLVVSNQARFPGIIVKGVDYVHPGRDTAGMLFFNEEGTENGGLIWDGRETNGRRASSGSLTFDRYHQDQTIQVIAIEDGAERTSGFRINDQPDGMMDFEALARIRAMPEGPDQDAAYAAANFGGVPRAFLGRQTTGASELVLRDAAGAPRLLLSVAADGAARIDFLDGEGRLVRSVSPGGISTP